MNITEENMENRQQASMFSDEFEHWEYRTDFLQNLTEIFKKEQEGIKIVKGSWQEKLLKTLQELSPREFEDFCSLLTQKMGIQSSPILNSSFPRNKGIDQVGFIVDLNNFRTNRIAINIKRLHADVTASELQRFQDAILKSPADYGIFISTASFSSQAKQLALMSNPPVTLIDGQTICELAARYNLHVDKDSNS